MIFGLRSRDTILQKFFKGLKSIRNIGLIYAYMIPSQRISTIKNGRGYLRQFRSPLPRKNFPVHTMLTIYHAIQAQNRPFHRILRGIYTNDSFTFQLGQELLHFQASIL